MARPLRAPLRRSFSDHIRDSTARALDAIWKNTRDRRLAGEGRMGRGPGGGEVVTGKPLDTQAQWCTRVMYGPISRVKFIPVTAVVSGSP